MGNEIAVVEADLENSCHGEAIVDLVTHYPDGMGPEFSDAARQELIPALRQHPTTRVFLAFDDQTPVGLGVCFVGFSTFRAQPLLNVHDLVVHRDHRGKGIGRSLLEAAETAARDGGYCRLTLEVHVGNEGARRLYNRFGFEPSEIDSHAQAFLTKEL